MSCEDEQSLAEEGTGVLDPACLPSDALCWLTAELLRKGQLFFLKDVKQLLSTPGCGQRTLGKPLKWLAEGGGGGRKAFSCTCDAHQGSVWTQPLHSAKKTAPGETEDESSGVAHPLLMSQTLAAHSLPVPCPCPACSTKPPAPSPQGTTATSPFHLLFPIHPFLIPPLPAPC